MDGVGSFPRVTVAQWLGVVLAPAVLAPAVLALASAVLALASAALALASIALALASAAPGCGVGPARAVAGP